MKLRYGLSRAVPAGVETAWGARLIAPADLLPDRQDITAASEADRAALIEWLNGGALVNALRFLHENTLLESREVLTLFEDERGVIVGSTNRSFGYVYVAAWLKARVCPS